jgi:hypothetical protein
MLSTDEVVACPDHTNVMLLISEIRPTQCGLHYCRSPHVIYVWCSLECSLASFNSPNTLLNIPFAHCSFRAYRRIATRSHSELELGPFIALLSASADQALNRICFLTCSMQHSECTQMLPAASANASELPWDDLKLSHACLRPGSNPGLPSELHVYSSMWSEAEALSEYGIVPE